MIKTEEIQELPLKIKRDSYIFKQLLKSEKGFVYEQINPESGRTVAYEVFKRKENKGGETIIGGRKIIFEPKVQYPGNGAFGTWAWSFSKLESAESKFDSFSE